MNTIKQEVHVVLDIMKSPLSPNASKQIDIELTQGETSASLIAEIRLGGKSVNLEGASIDFCVLRQDGKASFDKAELVQDGTVALDLPAYIAGISGDIALAYFKIADEAGLISITEPIGIHVGRGIDITAEQADPYISRYEGLLAQYSEIAEKIDAQLVQQQADYKAAENGRNELYTEAEQSRNTTFTAAETIRQTNETGRVEAEDKREADFAEMIQTMQGATFQILSADQYDSSTGIPTIDGLPTKVYLVPLGSGDRDGYTEWIYLDSDWERFGTTQVTVTPVNTDEIDAVMDGEKSEGDAVLSLTGLSYYNALTDSSYAGSIDYADNNLTLKAKDGTSLGEVKIGSSARIAGIEVDFGGLYTSIPAGYVPLDGSALLKSSYVELYNVYGDRHNPDGWSDATRFCVPDRGGRVAVGADEAFPMNTIGGEEAHSLTINEIPSHSHDGLFFGPNLDSVSLFGISGASAIYGLTWHQGSNNGPDQVHSGFSGGGQHHNNMQPYYTINKIVSTGQAFDSTGDLITAGIANGSVTEEKLSKSLLDKMNGVVLYDGVSSTLATLAEDISGFARVVVFGNVNGGEAYYQAEFNEPSGQALAYSISYIPTNFVRMACCTFNFSAKTVMISNSGYYDQNNGSQLISSLFAFSKIIGYRR